MFRSDQRFDLINEIFDKKPEAKMKFGLSRMREAIDILGYNLALSPTVLVAGTNGKGSTCHYLGQLLERFGKSVFRFSSPHLFEYSERFSLSGQVIDMKLLEVKLENLRDSLPRNLWDQLSFFEISTLLAFGISTESLPDWSIYEVGLGGRLDSTNVADPDVTAIVSIGLDHQAYLGNSYREIANEKAGIIRPGVPLFLGSSFASHWPSEALDVILAKADSLNAPVFREGIDFGREQQGDDALFWFGKSAGFSQKICGLNKIADYQSLNFLLSWAMTSYMYPTMNRCDSLNLKNFSGLPGRFDMRNINGARVLVDVCHNYEGVLELCKTASLRNMNLPVIVTILDDKPVLPMLKLLQQNFSRVVYVKSKGPRAFKGIQQIKSLGDIEIVESFERALTLLGIGSKSAVEPEAILCGSIIGISEILS